MSAETEAVVADADADAVCASCGTSAVDDVKLKKCTCGLVKYCCDGCRELDRPEHERVCRKRLAEISDRDAEIREKQLFAQPDESHLGDCPICCLPLSIDQSKSTFMGCCCKTICNGCNFANRRRELGAGLQPRCVFCREPPTKSKDFVKRVRKRVKKNDPVAIRFMGIERYCEGNYKGAVEYLIKAAGLGDVAAHYNLSVCIVRGKVLRRI